MIRRRGLALLVVIGVLGVLALLAVAFVTMAQLERRASQQRLYGTQALLLARSGIEDALARLSAGQDASLKVSAYLGEDWDASGALDGLETANDSFDPGVLDTASCPVGQALRPSFFTSDGLGKPVLLAVEGRQRGVSGRLGGGAYALKVEDESAKINVNGGFLDAQDRDVDGIQDYRDTDVRTADPRDTGRGWNGQLTRILGVLGTELGLAVTMGTDVVTRRPVGGYGSVEEVQQALGTAKDLSPYLTTSSWIDAKVVHPNQPPTQTSEIALSEVKKHRLPLRLEEGGRPAVNLNAASPLVLIALLQGLKGVTSHEPYQMKSYAFPPPLNPALVPSFVSSLVAFREGRDPAGTFAAASLTPSPFATWSVFSAFCDSLVPSVITGMPGAGGIGGRNLCAADLIKANFDPNTALNKELPDQIRWRWIDKSDLTAWSTEGSLGPTGTFRITCVGRFLNKDGLLLAERKEALLVEAFSLLRQTSQEDFVAGRPLKEYLSQSSLPWRCAGASAPWAGAGLAVMSYPSPPSALPPDASNASVTDGCLGLATLELEPKLSPLANGNGVLLFLHHFDLGLDADTPSRDPSWVLSGPGNPPSGGGLQADPREGCWPASGEPNTLYPDGLHVQPGRSPAYRLPGNLPAYAGGNHGTLCYWVKPVQQGFRDSIDVSVLRIGSVETQVLAVGRNGYAAPTVGAWGIVTDCREAEPLNPDPDVNIERQHCDQAHQTLRVPGLRWRLVLAHWDTSKDTSPEDVFVSVRGIGTSGTPMVQDPNPAGLAGAYANPPKGFDVLADQDLLGAGLFVIGAQGDPSWPIEASLDYANQVVDELALCDFGQGPTALQDEDDWARRRFSDGRYYKENDGCFLSTRLAPAGAASVRLLWARWTAILPRETRLEFDHPGNAPVPVSGIRRGLDPTLRNSDLQVELLDGGADLASAQVPPLMPGAFLRRTLPSFRYRVDFRPTPDWTPLDRLTQPVLETPFLDDITFAWQGTGGPRVLQWSCP